MADKGVGVVAVGHVHELQRHFVCICGQELETRMKGIWQDRILYNGVSGGHAKQAAGYEPS